ncbi:cytochrome P450 [Polychaeton citri CBS 116435]|uniref:Cytochrome P450 n=1 Tax=Polychaeton citri CBS 116435 TaxID=1314669 RepID=A0A9P4QE52_9PEZI|nr:cytochrome P450 [Polychaeton citri CBS 116435]
MARISLAIAVVAATLLIRFLLKAIKRRRRLHGLPGPPHSWFWGSLRSMGDVLMEQPTRAAPQTFPTFIKERYNLGDTFYMDAWPFGPQVLVTMDPRMMEDISVKKNLPKHELVADFLRWFGGANNIVSTEGAVWKKWRSAFNPGFNAGHLMASMVPLIVDEMAIFTKIMEKKAQANELFRMETWTTKLTVDIIGKVVLDTAFDTQTSHNKIVDAFNSQVRWVYQGAQFKPSELWDIRRPIILRWNNYVMRREIGKLLDARFATRSQRVKSKHVIDLALEAYLKEVKGAKGEINLANVTKIDNEFREAAISNVIVFIFAGHDTTSATICYAYYYLSKNPHSLAKMREELDEVFGKDLDVIADKFKANPYILNKLEYTNAVVKEVLRMQPPASTIRAGTPDVVLKDYDTGEEFPTDGLMVWPVDVGFHRHEKHWGDPNVFRPERFLENGDWSRDAYVPFSKGNRNCIGQELAMIEVRIVLAMTARSWDFEAKFSEVAKLRGDGTGYPCDVKGKQEQFGDEAYQIQLGTAKPREGMPCRLKLR